MRLDRVIDQGRMDMVADLANSVPARTIAKFLGVPESDEDLFYAMLAAFDSEGIDTL